MSDLLLQTKLFKPALRASLLTRSHLVDRLNQGLGKGTRGFAARLTLVSAPAGFGKSTLVLAWLAQLATAGLGFSGEETAWLSLDENDNDPIRFLTYLIAALQTAIPGLAQAALGALQSPQPPSVRAILTMLVNDISQKGGYVILVLDDYHLITASSVHQALTFLLDYMPPFLHLLITTRSDPPLPLSRLRSRNQIVEIRANDLRFTFDEVSYFFNQLMQLNLSDTDIAALAERTEGWVAGLQLAAIAMQSSLVAPGAKDLPNFVAAFTGSHRLILDYLTDEVLERRPPGTRSFLLQTAILDRFCARLCVAVTGESQSQQILQQLEHANLFLIPLDEERRWYRYHHLFADVLRNRLRQATSVMGEGLLAAPELHLRASAWFEAEGLIDEALQHALAAPDIERAAALVERYSIVMFQRSQIFVSRAWLGRLPPELVQTRPRLILAQGWATVLTGHGQALEEWLSEPHISAALGDPDLPPEVQGELALLRATQARYQNEDARSLSLALQARDLLADDDRGLLAGALYTIAAAHLHLGRITTASRVFAESVVAGELRGGPYMALAALQELSELQLRQGHLSQALQTCHQSLRMSSRWGWESVPAVGMAHIYFGHVFYHRNDLARAMEEMTGGIDRLQGSTDQDVLALGYLTLTLIHMAGDDYQGASAAIRRGEEWLTQMQMGDRGAGALLTLARVRLWLRQGRLQAAARALEPSTWWPEETNIGYLQRLALIRLRLAQHRVAPKKEILREAEQMQGQLLAHKEGEGWFGEVIELLLLQALLRQAHGDSTAALTPLEQAFSLAEPEGYIRLFVDEGEPSAALLHQARQRPLFPDYVDKLLAAFGPGNRQPPSTQLLLDPLSERELEVLALVATGASNREIATTLVVALPTVKKHLSNILSKLQVTSRSHAAAAARELGLL